MDRFGMAEIKNGQRDGSIELVDTTIVPVVAVAGKTAEYIA